jgi:hypothetical protein
MLQDLWETLSAYAMLCQVAEYLRFKFSCHETGLKPRQINTVLSLDLMSFLFTPILLTGFDRLDTLCFAAELDLLKSKHPCCHAQQFWKSLAVI